MCNTPEDLDLNGIDTVAIDIETYDPNLKTKGSGAIRNDGFICGIAVATDNDLAYFPLRHSDTDIDYERINKIWQVLNDKIFQNENITKVFHNAMYDVCWIRAVTGKMIKGRIVDTMIAASVIDENRFKYSLDALSKENANKERDFALIRKKTDPDRLIYIRKILNKGYDDGEVRVKYANIHTVKGLTFDNVIVDLTATRQEDYFTQLRLKYVAYSRGKFDCWTVASQGKYTLGVR